MLTEEIYFEKQQRMDEFSKVAQAHLRESKVMVVGLGGLGHPLVTYLAASGVGKIHLVDGDRVSLGNLSRQTLFATSDVEKSKALLLKEKLKSHFPYTEFTSFDDFITEDQLDLWKSRLGAVNLVVDGTDNLQSKYLIHDLCFKLKKNYIQGNVYQWEGNISFLLFSEESSRGCLKCLYGKNQVPRFTGNCADLGVSSASCGIMGSLMAQQALLLLLKEQRSFQHLEQWWFDLKSMSKFSFKGKEQKACPLCLDFCQESEKPLSWMKTYKELSKNALMVDLRELHEDKKNLRDFSRWKVLAVPLSSWDEQGKTLLPLKNREVVLLCQSGARAYKLASELRKRGLDHFFALKMPFSTQ